MLSELRTKPEIKVGRRPPERWLTVVVAIAATCSLAGCRADVTERVAMHGETATVTLREVIDQQMYSLAASQSKNPDPFDVAALESKGWTVSREVDSSDNHVITISKDVAVADLADVWSQGPVTGRMSTAPAFANGAIGTVQRGLFTDTVELESEIPTPMGSAAAGAADDPNAAGQAAGRALAASIIGIHLEALVPGEVLDSNAEKTPDGALRWDIALDKPTSIHAVYRIADREHITEACVAGALTLVIVFAALANRRRVAPRNESGPQVG